MFQHLQVYNDFSLIFMCFLLYFQYYESIYSFYPPNSFTSSDSTAIDLRFECSVCEKLFKRKGELTRHFNIVKTYNILRSDLDTLPENTINQFKGILVHYNCKKLPRGYKRLGKQTVLISATESQFYAVFKNYIHYYSATRGIYRYVFCKGSSN